MAKYCESCGALLKAGAKFCENCGAPVADEGNVFPADNGSVMGQTDGQTSEPQTGYEAPGYGAPDNGAQGFGASDNSAQGFGASDNGAQGFGTSDNSAQGYGASDNSAQGYGAQSYGTPNAYQGMVTSGDTGPSVLSIVALVLSCTCCLSLVGVILGVIDLLANKNDGKKHQLSIVAIAIGGALTVLGIIGSLIQ
ncbi:MAG: zinc ribbon domain-containing protein [Lachnospiraceae bacterium]|nr:zinc ribbon domain-containing protein [Lachnospiraceae bacterium]